MEAPRDVCARSGLNKRKIQGNARTETRVGKSRAHAYASWTARLLQRPRLSLALVTGDWLKRPDRSLQERHGREAGLTTSPSIE